LQDKRFTYTRAGSEQLGAGGYVTVIEGIDSADRFVVYEEDGIWAAVPVSERDDGSYELWLPGDVPRLFKFLPLVNSATIGPSFTARCFRPRRTATAWCLLPVARTAMSIRDF
jgi:hypothetical protein